MDTIFMNFGNIKTFDLILYLSDKMNLKRSDRYVAISTFNIY